MPFSTIATSSLFTRSLALPNSCIDLTLKFPKSTLGPERIYRSLQLSVRSGVLPEPEPLNHVAPSYITTLFLTIVK